jgi:HK97 family phage major capsid protein
MSTALLDETQQELAAKRTLADEKWRAFEEARAQAHKEGIDAVRDEQKLAALEAVHKEYATVAQEVKTLEAGLTRLVTMESEQGPGNPRPFEQGGGNGKRDDLAAELKSAATRVLESKAYKEMLESGVLNREKSRVQMNPVEAYNRDEVKALLNNAELKTLITGLSDTSAGAFVRNDRLAGLVSLLTQTPVVTDLITVGETDSDAVEYVKQDSFTNAAAETAEATAVTGASGTKPESAMAFSVVTANVRTIAHWIPATKRALADAGQLRTMIDSQLRDGVRRRLEAQVIAGDGVGENLTGILNTAGIGAQARGSDSDLDAIHKAITLVRLAYIEPTAVGMHPNSWQAIRLAKNANGDYLMGPPNMIGDRQVWGLPAHTTANYPANTALVGDFTEAVLWVREGITVTASDSHADFFIRNMVALLAEGRYAFGVPRPGAFSKVTGLTA